MKLKIVLAITGLALHVVECIEETTVTGVIGRPVTLPCTVSVSSASRIWKSTKLRTIARNSNVIADPEIFRLVHKTPRNGNWSLTILKVTKNDEDTYICAAAGHITRVRLKVEAAPYFEGHSGDVEQRITRHAGEPKTLTCDPKGIPKPETSWFRTDRHNSQKMHAVGSGIKLKVPEEEDIASEKFYICVASNTHGNVTLTVTITTSEQPTTQERKPKKFPDFETTPYITPQRETITENSDVLNSDTIKWLNVTNSVTKLIPKTITDSVAKRVTKKATSNKTDTLSSACPKTGPTKMLTYALAALLFCLGFPGVLFQI